MDYKHTINLPQTQFPMKADLARREPVTLAYWDALGIYNRQREVARRHAAAVVRRQRRHDLRVTDIEVGVMTGRFGRVGDARQPQDPARETGELERLHDRLALARPSFERVELALDLNV